MSFIGGVIIDRNLWLSREKKIYFGTEFIHLGVIFQDKIQGRCVIISKPYITIRFGNAQWSERSFQIWMYNWPKFIWSFPLITEHSKKMVVAKHPWKNFKNLLIHRLNGDYTYNIFKKYFYSEDIKLFWKITALIISVIPRVFLHKIHEIYFRNK